MAERFFDHFNALWQSKSASHPNVDLPEFFISSPDEMVEFGRCLSLAVRASSQNIVALCGNLGAGKTTLAKGMISALAKVDPSEVASPTFQYVQLYDAPQYGALRIAHFDLWRLHGVEEFLRLGLEEFLSAGLAIIEWPDRIDGLLPKTAIWVEATVVENGRLVRFLGIPR